jgi:hypothetical protein
LRPSVLTATGGNCCATFAVIRSLVLVDDTAVRRRRLAVQG